MKMHKVALYIAIFSYFSYIFATMMDNRIYRTQELVSRWEGLLRDLETAFSIGITLHDLQGRLSDSDGKLLIFGRNLHPHAVCQRLESSAYGSPLCSEHCVTQVNSQAAVEKKPFCTACWKGVSEVVAPIVRHGQVMLVVFAGPFKAIKHAGPDPSHFPVRILTAWRQLPALTDSKRKTLGRLLTTVGHGMLSEVEELLELHPSTNNRQEQIRYFIYIHAHENIHLADLGAYLHLSPSRTGHLVAELFGCPFKQLLQQERLRRAKVLLRTSMLSAKEVGERIGIANPYYFSRLFKSYTGVTPLAYRRAPE